MMNRRSLLALVLLLLLVCPSLLHPLPTSANVSASPFDALTPRTLGCPADAAVPTTGAAFRFQASFDGTLTTAVVSGTLAYIAQGPALAVVDFSVPSTPTRRGVVPLAQLTTNIVLSGTLAYLQFSDGVQLVDVADSDCPRLLGRYQTAPNVLVSGMNLIGTWVYVYTSAGLHIIDTRNPRHPVQYRVFTPSLGIASLNDWQGVGARRYSLSNNVVQIIDLQPPQQPVVRGEVELPSDLDLVRARLAVDGTRVFVVGALQNNVARLITLDVRDATRPRVLFNVLFATADEVLAFTARDGWGYLVGISSGLQVVDLRDPANPILRASTGIRGSTLQVVGNRAYVGGATYVLGDAHPLQVVDLQAVPQPRLIGRYPQTPITSWGTVQVRGNLLYASGAVAGGSSSEQATLRIFDLTNPFSPTLVGQAPFAPQQWVETRAYSLGSGPTLQVFDFTNPLSPTLRGTLELAPLGVTRFAADADTVLLAGNYGVECGKIFCRAYYVALSVVDVRDPDRPTLLGTMRTELPTREGGPDALVVRGNRAYVVSNGQVYPLDLADRAQPRVLPAYATPKSAVGLALVGDLAYVAETSGLSILNVSTPTTPVLRSRIALPLPYGSVFAIRIEGDTALLQNHMYGTILLDVANPAQPRFRARYPVAGDVQLRGNALYLAANSLQVLQLQSTRLLTDLALPLIGR